MIRKTVCILVFLSIALGFILTCRGGSCTLVSTDAGFGICSKKPQYVKGNMVILETTEDGKSEKVVKRIIAYQGDTVENKDGYCYINGKQTAFTYQISDKESYTVENDFLVWDEDSSADVCKEDISGQFAEVLFTSNAVCILLLLFFI